MVWAETSPNRLAKFSRISVNKQMVRWLISSFTRGLVVVDSEIGNVSFQFQAVSSFPLWGSTYTTYMLLLRPKNLFQDAS